MKSLNKIALSAVIFIISISTPITALANSSWYWFGNIRPVYILPVIAVITITVEALAINYFGKINMPQKTVLIVISANLLSFACPYIINCFWQTPNYPLDMLIENTPSYTVTSVFLIMTLAVEVPVVYMALRKNSESKRNLIASVILSNTVTTLLAAAAERIICRGTYL